MYAALWRILPGPLWVRIAILTAATVVVAILLMLFVFPALDVALTSREVTVNQ
ncbi:MAG: hypothetical protein RIR88_758 [Actinomycetota bacterium]